jgi:hypothetical protein
MSSGLLPQVVRAKNTVVALFGQRRSTLPDQYKNNTWFELNDSDLVLVFVHGLYSDSAACWTCDSNESPTYWPKLVRVDERLGSPSIFLGGYYATGTKGYGLNDCANELMRALRIPHAEKRVSVMDKQRIVFICHSAGGVVVRYMLDLYADDFSTKTVGLLLLASPSYGSTYASLRALLRSGGDNLVAQLAWGNDMLSDLDRRFRSLLQSGRIPRLIGKEAYENTKPLPFGLAKIVGEHSASRYFADPAHLPLSSHTSICKPDCAEHQTHQLLIEFITTNFSRASPAVSRTVGPQVAVPDSLARIALFEFYTEGCEPYYLVRAVDTDFASAVTVSNVWLWGPSGCGKTSVVRRHAIVNRRAYIYIPLGQTEPDAVAACLRDIWLSLLQKLKLATPPVIDLPTATLVVAIGDLIATYLPNHIIYLDELPLHSAEDLQRFWGHLRTVVAVAQEQAACDPRFVISTLTLPDLRLPRKGMPERLEVLESSVWQSDELGALVQRIDAALSLALTASAQVQLVRSADGSPRFIKKVLRQYHIRPRTLDFHIEEVRRESQ